MRGWNKNCHFRIEQGLSSLSISCFIVQQTPKQSLNWFFCTLTGWYLELTIFNCAFNYYFIVKCVLTFASDINSQDIFLCVSYGNNSFSTRDAYFSSCVSCISDYNVCNALPLLECILLNTWVFCNYKLRYTVSLMHFKPLGTKCRLSHKKCTHFLMFFNSYIQIYPFRKPATHEHLRAIEDMCGTIPEHMLVDAFWSLNQGCQGYI